MNKYRLPGKDIIITDPIIIPHGFVGSNYKDGIANGSFTVQIKLVTASTTVLHELKDETLPESFTDLHIIGWINLQMKKFLIDG